VKKTKTILLPTDFYGVARNAFLYAIRLAETLDVTIMAVHVDEFILPGA